MFLFPSLNILVVLIDILLYACHTILKQPSHLSSFIIIVAIINCDVWQPCGAALAQLHNLHNLCMRATELILQDDDDDASWAARHSQWLSEFNYGKGGNVVLLFVSSNNKSTTAARALLLTPKWQTTTATNKMSYNTKYNNISLL